MMNMLRWVVAVTMLLSAWPVNALDAPRSLHAEYRISFLGLKVASSSFTSSFAGERYRIEGRIRSAGLARLFDRTDATTRITGQISGNKLEPDEYLLNYVHDGKEKMTSIRYLEGRVAATENRPSLRPRGKDYVPLGPADLAAALDPVSATIIRASSPREVCNRTLRAYDGEFRVDLKLSHVGTKPFSTQGFKGEAVHCRADFRPVAGYRKGRRALEFMQRKSRIEIAFAPIGGTDVYAPVTATVDTEIGPVKLHATRFTVAD